MKTSAKFAAVALVASIGTAALTAQVTATGRPAPIKLGQPVTANTVGGEGRTEARLAEMQVEIDKLRADLKDANNKIVSLQTSVKNTSLKVFELAPVVGKFKNHTHYFNVFVTSEAHTTEGRNKNRAAGEHTSVPTSECTRKPNAEAAPGYDILWKHTWQMEWNCPAGN